MTLLDSHHHLDFLPSPEARAAFLAALATRDVRVVAQTMTPSAFVALADERRHPRPGVPAPLWSLGLHPWELGDPERAEAELGVLAQAVAETRFVGEIGLDLSPRRLALAPEGWQREVLARLLRCVCAAAPATTADGPVVLSIHAVRSARAVLEVLGDVGIDHRDDVVPVFHWFTGTSDELTDLVRLGGFVSVHPAMLGSKRGRAYVRQVPVDRLLLESDLPPEPVALGPDVDAAAVGRAHADELVATLQASVEALSHLRDEDVLPHLERTQAKLYGVA